MEKKVKIKIKTLSFTNNKKTKNTLYNSELCQKKRMYRKNITIHVQYRNSLVKNQRVYMHVRM